MNFSPLTRSKSYNPFRRTLLRPLLHNFSAIKPVSQLNGMIYGANCQKSSKSFRRLLLPLFVPVSPLAAHSYRKVGGTPLPVPTLPNISPPCNSFISSNLSRFRVGPPHVSLLESYRCRKRAWGRGAKIYFFRNCSPGSPEPGACTPQPEQRRAPVTQASACGC
jgi:hypothetical protein